MTIRDSKNNFLTLGWAVTPGLDPRYWLTPNPVPGKQEISDLVNIPSESIANHTAIIAQSGSGKSFFLGRLVEEILLKTKSRCLILDTNGDFIRVGEVQSAELWNDPYYDVIKGDGKLPDEEKRFEFVERWEKVKIRVISARYHRTQLAKPFNLPWTSLSEKLLSTDVYHIFRDEFYLCHDFVKAVKNLVFAKIYGSDASANLLEESEALLNAAIEYKGKDFKEFVISRFKINEFIDSYVPECRSTYNLSNIVDLSVEGAEQPLRVKIAGRSLDLILTPRKKFKNKREWKKELEKVMKLIKEGTLESCKQFETEIIKHSIDTVCQLPKYISEQSIRLYFGRAKACQAGNIFDIYVKGKEYLQEPLPHLEVVDLPSLNNKEVRLMAVSSILEKEFERVRQNWDNVVRDSEEDLRAPTFVIVDEAHNLIPQNSQDNATIALREQFRAIAAEGRKYGLFLILISQRPDKLDRLILSECENKVIMRLGTVSVLNLTCELLGLNDISRKQLEKCLEFKISRGLLVGHWTGHEPMFFYSAARRTVEGGKNLEKNFWAIPWPEVEKADQKLIKDSGKKKSKKSKSPAFSKRAIEVKKHSNEDNKALEKRKGLKKGTVRSGPTAKST